MNIRRYAIAAIVSVSAHAAIMNQWDQNIAFAMPVGEATHSISLTMLPVVSTKPSQAPSSSSIQPKATSESRNTTKAVPVKAQKSKAKPKKIVKKVTATKPVLTKKQVTPPAKPKVKPASNTPKTSVVKTQPQTNTGTPKASKQGVAEKPVLIEKPQFLSPPNKPRYPRLARRKGLEGTAMYEIWLDENGNKIKLNLLQSTGASMLDNAALDAIQTWKFSPKKINGIAVAHRVQIPIRFQLD